MIIQIKPLCKKHNITMEQLAEKIDVSPQTLRMWACGRTTPSMWAINAIASTFNCSINELVKLDESVNPLPRPKNLQHYQKRQLTPLPQPVDSCVWGGHSSHYKHFNQLPDRAILLLKEGDAYFTRHVRFITKTSKNRGVLPQHLIYSIHKINNPDAYILTTVTPKGLIKHQKSFDELLKMLYLPVQECPTNE